MQNNTIIGHHNILWKFKELNGNERKLGDLQKNINNIIINNPGEKGTEADANLLFDYVWLGNYRVADDFNFVTDNRIRHIINATYDIPNSFAFINYTTFSIQDQDACNQSILDMLDQGADIINSAIIKKQSILVHCKRGHHRSASIIAFYLMKYYNMSLGDAIYFIKCKRPTAFRRMTCMLQTLIDYEYCKIT